MLPDVAAFFDHLLGLGTEAQALTTLQVATRALLIYFAAFAMLRLGEHRFLGKNTAFDIVLGFIFGSLLSRAINGAEPLGGTLLAGLVLLSMHWLFATASLHSRRVQKIISGSPIPLVKDGAVQSEGLRKSRISEAVLRENLRTRAHLTDPAQVRRAYYEPSGSVSVIPREGDPREGDSSEGDEPRVLEVTVEDGVQTVRIALEDEP
jgi:uncharacterized membrane protein YcaP (DUF421 family)